MIPFAIFGYSFAAAAVLIPGYMLLSALTGLWTLKRFGDRRVAERRSSL